MSFDARASRKRASVSHRLLPPRLATLLDLGTDRLIALCRALDFDSKETRSAADLFRKIAGPWGRFPLDGSPPWTSHVTDDHTPFEFSLAMDGERPEIGFLMESQGAVPSLSSNWEAARGVNRQLAAAFGVDLERFSTVQDLFAPTAESSRFAMWHAVSLRPGAAPEFTIYLNPQANGAADAGATIDAAMARLGFRCASVRLPKIGPDDEICYFSLDLSSAPEARVMVYIAHHRATAARIEAAVSSARGYRPSRAAEFCEAMADSSGPFEARPVLTSFSFVRGSTVPAVGTIHFPVRSYAGSDGVVNERVLRYIHEESAPSYRVALDAFARRSLLDRSGMQASVSLRLDEDRDRLAVYLAPEAYDVRVSRLSTRPPRRSSIPARASNG